MTKEEERKKLVEAMTSCNFEESCESLGFKIVNNAEESKGKKKDTI